MEVNSLGKEIDTSLVIEIETLIVKNTGNENIPIDVFSSRNKKMNIFSYIIESQRKTQRRNE